MSENNNIPNEEELWNRLSDPVQTPAPKASPAPKAEPTVKAEPAHKSPKKIDGFFMACMAGVAAVSVAATLLIGSMFGGSTTPVPSAKDPVQEDNSAAITALEQENADLRAKLEEQTKQIKDLQTDLIALMGSEEFLANASTDPNESSEVLDAQKQALDTYAQIQEAYADFDRAKLEELVPQMNQQLTYLTPEMLNNYYLVLEYMEQPSNG